MKNQTHSDLCRRHKTLVAEYNDITDIVIHLKKFMNRFWNYKSDYPADWKDMGEKLDKYRESLETLKINIIQVKHDLRTCCLK